MDEVTLGSVAIPVYAQRHAYLTNRIGPTIRAIAERGEDVTAERIVEYAQGGTYQLLCALMPALAKRMPEWQFAGFGSADAMATREYDEDLDESPTLPEIITAFRVAMRVNGIDELVKLGKMIDPRLIRAQLVTAIETNMAQSIVSANSLPTSGGSDPTSSTTPDQTAEANGAAPSPDSSL